MSKNAHIMCVAAGRGEGRHAPAIGFSKIKGTLADAIDGDLWIGPRPRLETLRPEILPEGTMETLLNSLSSNVASAIDTLARDIGFGGAAVAEPAGATLAVSYPAYLQIIPYYLFRKGGRYLRYVRPDKGSEARLHGKVSIGIGGHVDLTDVVANGDGQIDLLATLELAGSREAKEEIGVTLGEVSFRFIGTIYAVDTEVDRVHLGIVGVCDLTDEQVNALDVNHEIGDHAFLTLAEVQSEAAADPNKHLETWTRLVIESNPLA